MLNIVEKEERKSRKHLKKNKQALDSLMGRGAGEQDMSSDRDDEQEEEMKTERRRN